jgi:peptidylprolyl isomerase
MISMIAIFLAAVVVAKPAPPADLTAPPADAAKLENGLVMKQLAPGAGSEHPDANDYVHIRYAVWKASDGSVVDYTKQGGAAFVQLSTMLPGMREMLLHMTRGERSRGWIPSSLGGGKIAPEETYVMDAELVDIVPPPSAPADVAAPPADATTTASGLAYKVLRPGTGTKHPRRRDSVVVHYSGWSTDGNMFDSSVMRDEPAEFALDAVIPGWTEGVQLMTEGEKMRFWIPAKLAYKNQPGMPAGTLVFDIELIKIK